MIDKGYQRTRENKEIVCNSEWLLTRQEITVEPWEKCDEWLIAKLIKGRISRLISLLIESLPWYTACICQITLPISISRSSFCFILPRYCRGRSSIAEGKVIPPASGRVHRRGWGRCSDINNIHVSFEGRSVFASAMQGRAVRGWEANSGGTPVEQPPV